MPKPINLLELELLLIPLASYAEAEARTLDEIGLPLCAQNARKAAAQARAMREAIKAGGETVHIVQREDRR